MVRFEFPTFQRNNFKTTYTRIDRDRAKRIPGPNIDLLNLFGAVARYISLGMAGRGFDSHPGENTFTNNGSPPDINLGVCL